MSKDKGRVGARHKGPPSRYGGGGYQDICSKTQSGYNGSGKLPQKNLNLTIDDLRMMGLSGKWLEIAGRVGVETWVEIWSILDRENIDQPPESRDCLRLRVPSYSKLVKFLRNQRIQLLASQGFNAEQISSDLRRLKIEPVCTPQIMHILKKMNEGNNG